MTICAPTDSQGSFGRIFFLKTLKVLPSDRDAIVRRRDFVGQVAQNRVVLQQVSQRLGIGQVVDGHKFEVGIIERSAQHVAPNAAKAVNAYFNCHFSSEELP